MVWLIASLRYTNPFALTRSLIPWRRLNHLSSNKPHWFIYSVPTMWKTVLDLGETLGQYDRCLTFALPKSTPSIPPRNVGWLWYLINQWGLTNQTPVFPPHHHPLWLCLLNSVYPNADTHLNYLLILLLIYLCRLLYISSLSPPNCCLGSI